MKIILLTLSFCFLIVTCRAQTVIQLPVEGYVPGRCHQKEVYYLIPGHEGQVQAACPLNEEEILKRLNSEVSFLKDNPAYKDKGTVGVLISCEGKMVQCKMDKKTKSPELDQQIEAVFKSMGEWAAGKLNEKEVDSMRLFKFRIKNGEFSL